MRLRSAVRAAAEDRTSRRFTEAVAVATYGIGIAAALNVLLSAANKFEDWPMLVGALTFATMIIGARVHLHRMPDQRRACTIYSWVVSCLACIFVHGPVYVVPRLYPVPQLPAAHWSAISMLAALYAFFTVHVGIEHVPRMLDRVVMVGGVALTPRGFTELGQPHTTLYMFFGLVVGEVIGFTLDHRIWVRELAHADELADAERQAARVINHTSKRIMCNTAQCCDVVLACLRAHAPPGAFADMDEAASLLQATRAQNVSGFHVCQSMVLQAAIIRGEHTPVLKQFTVRMHALTSYAMVRALMCA